MPEEQDNQIERRESEGGIARRSHIARRGMNAANYVRGLSISQKTRNIIDPADPDRSPFELEVERALISKGHKVERRVRVSEYIIDLAIISEDGRKYDLGIECNGTPRFRETPYNILARKAMRLKILKDEGWNSHPILANEWFSHPELELEKLEAVLAKIRSNF